MLILCFAFIWAVYILAIAAVGLIAAPEPSDLAVVLGNEIKRNGKPADRLKARLDCGLDLYRRKIVPRIMVSGGTGKSGFSEAQVMHDYLRHAGVPDADIIVDPVGVNTMATAVNTAELMRQHGWKTVIAVSQYYHVPRSVYAFRKAGIASVSGARPFYFEWFDLYAIARESVALPAYFAKMPDKK